MAPRRLTTSSGRRPQQNNEGRGRSSGNRLIRPADSGLRSALSYGGGGRGRPRNINSSQQIRRRPAQNTSLNRIGGRLAQGSALSAGFSTNSRGQRRGALRRRGSFRRGPESAGSQGGDRPAFSRGRRGDRGRGGRGRFRGRARGDARVTAESLDAALDKYMGPEAGNARLDSELDAYFGRAGVQAPEDNVVMVEK